MEQRLIEDVFSVIRGISFPKTARLEESGEYIGCLRTANIQKKVMWDDLWRIPAKYLNRQEQIIKRNDIIVSIANSLTHLGKSAIVTYPPSKCTFGTFIVVLRPKKGFNPQFLYYALQSEYYYKQVRSLASTTTNISNISTTKLKSIKLPIPPLPEQERIVARIEELFSQLDAGVETLKKTKAQLAVYRQAVLKEAFEELKEFVPLASISERIFDGPFGSNLKTADYVSEGIRVVRLENIKPGWFDDSKQSFVTEAKYETIKQHTVYPSDLIMSTFMADSIKICQLPAYVSFAVNKADCIGIRLLDGFMPKFIMYFLLQKEIYQRIAVDVHGATRPRVNTKQIKAIAVPKATLELQERIVSSIEKKLSLCDSINMSVDYALLQAEAMQQSILKQAFGGDL